MDLVLPEHRRRMQIHYMKQFKKRLPSTVYEFPFRAKNGDTIWLAQNATFITAGDEIIGFHFIARDITDRVKAERAVRESHERFRELAELMPAIVFEVDVDGNLTYANRRGMEEFGVTPEIMDKGLNVFDLVVPEDRERAMKNMRKVLEGGPDGNEYSVRKMDGTIIPVLSYTCPIMRDGKPVGLRGVEIDISELKEREEREKELQGKLARAERMESLGLLAGGVAHDLNNILGPIVGYPDLILKHLEPDHPVRNDILEMQTAATRAGTIIQDLLTLARRGHLKTEAVDLNKVVMSYLASPGFKELKGRFPNVALDTNLEPNTKPIMGSVPHLSQVVMNLVMNAFEAMPHGGKTTLTTSLVRLNRPLSGYERIEEGEYVVLRARDTGPGIETSDLEHIFDPFFTRKKMGRSGSGLGLSVVFGVVKDLQGFVDIHSQIGHGTEFILYFPLALIQEKPTEESLKDYSGTETILIVDDIPSQLKLASRLLANLGYGVITRDSGRAAVQFLQQHEVDLIVLDMILEDDFDGLDAYREIVKLHPGQPCIIASGFSESERVKEAQSLGAGAFISKPYTVEKIGKAVREELDNIRTV
jgi:PAS domain S-box-containing protein